MQLKDQVLVVTGGGRGIGAALCRRFAQESPRGVVVADIDYPRAQEVAASIDGLAVACDVSSESACIGGRPPRLRLGMAGK